MNLIPQDYLENPELHCSVLDALFHMDPYVTTEDIEMYARGIQEVDPMQRAGVDAETDCFTMMQMQDSCTFVTGDQLYELDEGELD